MHRNFAFLLETNFSKKIKKKTNSFAVLLYSHSLVRFLMKVQFLSRLILFFTFKNINAIKKYNKKF